MMSRWTRLLTIRDYFQWDEVMQDYDHNHNQWQARLESTSRRRLGGGGEGRGTWWWAVDLGAEVEMKSERKQRLHSKNFLQFAK